MRAVVDTVLDTAAGAHRVGDGHDMPSQPGEHGHEVRQLVVPHGADPVRQLAVWGFELIAWSGASRAPDGVWLDCQVRRRAPQPAGAQPHGSFHETGGSPDEPPAAPHAPPHAPGLVIADGERAVPVQRVSALVVARVAGQGADSPVLLTRYSGRTRRPGYWGLPGGGMEPAEEPPQTVRRECWEETGHEVRVGRLLGVSSDHFIGRAPSGRLEDFHAIHVVYEGTCAAAYPPVVHDHDGSTDAAAWVACADLPGWLLTPTARRQLTFARLRSGAP